MITAPTMAELLRAKPEDNSAYVRAVKQLRAAAQEAERALGGPVYIESQDTSETAGCYVTTFRFRLVEQPPE